MEVLELHVSQVALFSTAASFPTSAFKEEAVNVGTNFCELGVLSYVLGVGHVGDKTHIVEGKLVSTGSDLHDGRQVGHRVEQE